MIKKGDTLIEVTIAVGIFSLVAISVIAVMNGGTSNIQNSLETTLAREEIDVQAEALRFIHSAYLADEESGEESDPYAGIWQKITSRAFIPGAIEELNTKVQQFKPESCQAVYGDTDTLSQYAFVINPRVLGSLFKVDTDGKTVIDRDKQEAAYYSYKDHSANFRPTPTYPRLIFNTKTLNNEDSLVERDSETNINMVEGIYIVAVKDPGSTNIIGEGSRVSAYYDFYIRTCWYSNNSEIPSTISTVVRLYDPNVLKK